MIRLLFSTAIFLITDLFLKGSRQFKQSNLKPAIQIGSSESSQSLAT